VVYFGSLVCFVAIWNIIVVWYILAVWYILWLFWYISPRFGRLYQENSGILVPVDVHSSASEGFPNGPVETKIARFKDVKNT
jgi:hypothetical protein